VPRTGYIKANPTLSRLFFPVGTKVLSHGPKVISTFIFNESFRQTEQENIFMYLVTFRKQSVFDVWVANNYVKLLRPFDPTNLGLDTLATGTEHSWKAWGVEFFSKPQSVFTYSVSIRSGGYYANGSRFNVTSEIGYRIQPYVSFNVSSNVNKITLPEPWGERTIWLVGPRLDVTMTNKLFFTAFAQYNDQSKNVNLNTRVQWRYRPASDLFIVYTDNYFPQTFNVKNRALVLKFTYWWNL
jgi:hypothetical protein